VVAVGAIARRLTVAATGKDELIAQVVAELRASRSASDQVEEAAAEHLGINRTDQRCLDIIERLGPLTAGRLAEESGLTTGSVTVLIDRLEAAGHVNRIPDQADRRKVLVEVTPETRALERELHGYLANHGRPRLARFTVAELTLLRDFLRINSELNAEQAALIRARPGR